MVQDYGNNNVDYSDAYGGTGGNGGGGNYGMDYIEDYNFGVDIYA